MPFFHAKTPLDRAFEVSLVLKALDGLLETLGGIAFLFIHPDQVVHTADRILGSHPHSWVGRTLLDWAHGFTKGAAIFAALYLLSHGLVKLVMVIAIWREHLWAYPGLIIVTFGFIVYQVYHMIANGPSASFIALTVFDGIVIYLTSREYGHQKVRLQRLHAERTEE